MHNGAIEGFQRSVMRPLRNALSDESYAAVSGATDSETVFAMLLDALRDGADLGEALLSTVRLVAEVCETAGRMARLNLAVTDGETMAFTRFSTRGPGNSLYLLEGGASFPGAVVVASERLNEDAGWREVPDRHLLVAGRSGVSLRPM
jgi:glutamine amidotransferase